MASKEKITSLLEEMESRFRLFLKEGHYKDVLLAMGNLSSYSFSNQLLILSQKTDATCVRGYGGWKKEGRQVKRGEKGILIFSPILKKGKEGAERTCVGFRAGYVFDLSQTEGKDLLDFRPDESKAVAMKKEIGRGLSKVVARRGYRVFEGEREELGEGCFGLCDHRKKEIKILKGLGDLQSISTLAHECAHALAHGTERDDFAGLLPSEKRGIKEIEAESIAFVVTSFLGLDVSAFNFAYIASWSEGDLGKMKKNLEVVSRCAKELIQGIQEEMPSS